jgi:hypothetical protein
MTRRTRTVVLGAVALAAIGAALLALRPNPDARITREHFKRIRQGMSRAEVEAILGSEGSDILRTFSGSDLETPEEPSGCKTTCWRSDTTMIEVAFDASGSVRESSCHSLHKLSRSRLEEWLWRVKRQWHRWFPE